MRAAWFGVAIVLASAHPGRAEVSVRAAAGSVDITANATPLADVLDRLAKQTGMKVVYEGPAPRQLVTVSLLGRSPAEAVHDLLEGQGLNYALLGDSAGTGVQTLLMTGAAAPVVASSSSAPHPSASMRRPGPPPMSSPDSVEEVEEEEPEEEPSTEPQPQPTSSPGADPAATGGVPGAAIPGAAPGALPGGPAPYMGGPTGMPNPFAPAGGAPVPGTAPSPGQTPPPVQASPGIPRYTPPTAPGFVPVNPLSPLGPFAPVIPAVPGSPTTGTPGSPTEPAEPKEPPD
jgi:hypothetical protein